MSIAPDGNNHRVVSHSLRQERFIKLALVIACIGALLFSYNWGRRGEVEVNEQLYQKNAELQSQLNAAEADRQQYLHSITLLESARKIDKLALDNVRALVRGLEDDKAQLNEELAFYHSVIAPENAKPGIRLHEFNLLPGSEHGRFRLRFVVSQVSRNNDFRKGKVSVTLEGTQNDKDKSISLFEMAGQKASSLPLGFRYFQVLPESRGFFEFKLPEAFKPRSVRVIINMHTGPVRKLDEAFDWNEELAADVEKDLEQEKTGKKEKKWYKPDSMEPANTGRG